MYISYDEYTALYDPIEGKLFNRLAFEACRYIDRLTTGADGVKKLQVAFPTDEDSAATVKRCAAHIINLLAQVQEAEQSASLGRGFVQTANGLQGRVISSVSSGSESISYSTGVGKTAVDTAAADPAAKSNMIYWTIRNYLSGTTDANGVNLLYMGRYPA